MNSTELFIDLEGGVEQFDCADGKFLFSEKKIDTQWVYINCKYVDEKITKIIPLNIYRKMGFIWGNHVNVRDGYGKNYRKHKVLYQFNNGAVVEILEKRDGWFKIKPVMNPSKYCPKGFDIEKVPQWVKDDFVMHVPPQKKPLQNKKHGMTVIEQKAKNAQKQQEEAARKKRLNGYMFDAWKDELRDNIRKYPLNGPRPW